MDENRLLPGAMESALPGLGSKTPIQPLYINPRPDVITPEGIRAKVANTNRLCRWAGRHFTYGTDRNAKDGYSINFNGKTLRNVNERGLEIFLPFTKENLEKCIKE